MHFSCLFTLFYIDMRPFCDKAATVLRRNWGLQEFDKNDSYVICKIRFRTLIIINYGQMHTKKSRKGDHWGGEGGGSTLIVSLTFDGFPHSYPV